MINADKPARWKDDVAESVQMYNDWFLGSAPQTYRNARLEAKVRVEEVFAATSDLRNLTPPVVLTDTTMLAVLRMCTAPPLARDRLAGFADVSRSLVKVLELSGPPVRKAAAALDVELAAMCDVLVPLLDIDLFPWIPASSSTVPLDRELAAMVVTDRLTGAWADPIIRNAQETRQLACLETWLTDRGYEMKSHPADRPLDEMEPGTFAFRMQVVTATDDGRRVNMPIDAVIQPLTAKTGHLPILIEAKSAGDFANTNKRRKEEATKNRQLRGTFGNGLSLMLLLCGYFDTPYLGYEAGEGLDWIWEHRMDDLSDAGV